MAKEKQNDKKQDENQQGEEQNNQELDELEQIKQEAEEESSKEEELQGIKKERDDIQKELDKYKEIASQTQNQYVSLKKDFDSYINRVESQQKEQKTTNLIEVMNNIIPMVEELRRTVENVPNDLEGNQRVDGVLVVYNSLLKKLNEQGVYQFDAKGHSFDTTYHEPIGSEQVEYDKKGTVISEFEKGYVYNKDGENKLIRPAKVVIGQ